MLPVLALLLSDQLDVQLLDKSPCDDVSKNVGCQSGPGSLSKLNLKSDAPPPVESEEEFVLISGFASSSCPNSDYSDKSDRGEYYVKYWTGRYLADARKRLQAQIDGYDLAIEDVYAMQHLCAYEVPFSFLSFCVYIEADCFD